MAPLESDDPWLMTVVLDPGRAGATRTRAPAGPAPRPIDPARCCVFDVEVYPGRWCVGFAWPDASGALTFRVVQERTELAQTLAEFVDQGLTLVGFNSASFDVPVVRAILGGHDPYAPAQALVRGESFPIPAARLPEFPCDHVDLSARVRRGGGFPGLKTLAANLGRPVLRELPYNPGAVLTDDQWVEVVAYNQIDLGHTWALLERFAPELEALAALSEDLGQDLRSTPTPKVCETVFLDAYNREHGGDPVKPWPTSAVFYPGVRGVTRPRTEAAARWYDQVVNRPLPVVDRGERRQVVVPKARFTIGHLTLQVGAGGLHSVDQPRVYYRTRKVRLVSVDVASYYPSLIATKAISPRSYGTTGAATYQSILDRRLETKRRAKATDDPAERARLDVQATALKLVINAAFGKFGDQWSTLFDPAALVAVTLSGQLMLVDLIERLAAVGVQVISANTDGLFLHVKRTNKRWRKVLAGWQRDTEMMLEVESLHRLLILATNRFATRDAKGRIKRKGAGLKGTFEPLSSPNTLIVADAVTAALLEDVPPERTIAACTEAARFCSISRRSRKVQAAVFVTADGAETELGKVSRWYHARESGCRIEHRFEGGRHTTPSGAKGIALLPDLPASGRPSDLDLTWYLREARKAVQKTPGYRHRSRRLLAGHEPALAVLDRGLLPVPKRQKAQPPGGDAGAPTLLWNWAWPGYPSIGCYTGWRVGILVIDVDDFATFRAKVERGNTPLLHDRWRDLDGALVSCHGDATADQVRTGQARGKLIFRLEGDAEHGLARVKVDRWRAKWGIDTFYGKGIPTIVGAHPDGSTYRLDGTLGAAPDWLLAELTPKLRPKKAADPGKITEPVDPAALAGLARELTEIAPELGNGTVGWREKDLGEGRAILVGRCPWHEDGAADDLSAGFNAEGLPYVLCLHTGCSAVPAVNTALKERHPSTTGAVADADGAGDGATTTPFEATADTDAADSDKGHATKPTKVHEAADDPHRLARIYRDTRCQHKDGVTLRFWQGEPYRWDGAYHALPVKELHSEIASVAKHELDRVNVWEIAQWTQRGGKDERGKPCKKPTAGKVSNQLISNIITAYSGYALIPGKVQQPSWFLTPAPFPADEVLPTRNCLVYLPWFVDGRQDAIHEPTPLFFGPYSLDYDFNASAPEPRQWLAFLHSLWPADPESIATLGEWFGYQLTPDTKHQKIGMIIGPKRSGKGTIARIMSAMIGRDNVANPTLSSLGTNFGLAPLIGKPSAVISDARLSHRTDVAQVVERLLSISGEDAQDIDRKHLPAVTVRLPTRFTFISNELPRLTETSGALAGRMVILRLTTSFFGREDLALEAKLMKELPGILLWSIAGWKRLRDRGHFVQPESARPLVEELEQLASPVGAFVAEVCAVGPGKDVPTIVLFNAWLEWCRVNNRERAGDLASFGRNLRAVLPTLTTTQVRQGGVRHRVFEGIALKGTA